MIEKVVNKMETIYKNQVGPLKWNEYMQKHIFERYARHQYSELYKHLESNVKFKGIYKNKRCFILGNGPSLKEEDLSFLKDEITITVNQASRASYFSEINTNYHFIADPKFFVLDKNKPEDLEVLEAIMKINTPRNKPVCFVPIQYRNFIQDSGLLQELSISYFNPSLHLCEGYNTDIDFCKFIPGSDTVVHYAIMFAIYTGCSEIVLLGCDCTLILRDIQEMLNIPIDTYSYDMTKNEIKRLRANNQERDFVNMMEGNIKVFKEYGYLNDFCVSKGIKLYNATKCSLLDTVPRKSLKDIVSERK